MGITNKQKFTLGLDREHEILFAHIYDLAQQHEKYFKTQISGFLSESSQSELIKRKKLLPCDFELCGGYEDAERKLAVFSDNKGEALPISVLFIKSSRLRGLTHRDFLGSIMALGIKREKIGDIIIGEDKCSVIMISDIVQFASRNLISVGRVGVNTEIGCVSDIDIPQKSFKEIKGTVASLRLDAVLALFLGTGRGNVSEKISGGLVFVNGICAQKSDMRLSGGEIISVRGKGKAILAVGGISKKDRIFITLSKYV